MITSWSISRAQVFETCAWRAFLQFVEKVPDTQPRPAADRGTQIHLEAEHYVRGTGDFTPALRRFADDFTALKKHFAAGRVTCEQEWGFDADWNVADWRGAWLRIKCDAVCELTRRHAAVIDYKSGKRFGNEVKHAVQLQLYALAALLRYPDLERVTAELWYLDVNELAAFQMTRAQIPTVLRRFDALGRKVTQATEFRPNPNRHSCQYCPYHASRQGNCTFGAPLDLAPTPSLDFVLPPMPTAPALQRLLSQDAEALRRATEAMALTQTRLPKKRA